MAYTGQQAQRPAAISGGLQTWTESQAEGSVARSAGEDGQTIKVRRRVTIPIRIGQATVTVKAEEVAEWRDWYEIRCQGGVLPTKFRMPPTCEEELWRFSTPLTYDWIDKNACRISFSLEQLPQWRF
jgi:hypothetical protein